MKPFVFGMILALPWIMSIDARMKRFFPVLLAMLIALVAYQQALGLAHLFAANLGGSGISFPDGFGARARALLPPAERKPDGSAILARNPFDSITGPLDKATQPAPPIEAPEGNAENPYADPICNAGRVHLITTADDPSWSFASIAIGAERAVLRRIGDGVGDQTLYAMVWDRVWMLKGTQRCQLPLYRGVKAAPVKEPGVTGGDPPPPPPDPYGIAKLIRPISSTQFDVDRSVIPRIMDKRNELFRTLRTIPTNDADGSTIKLKGIKPESPLSLLGMEDGDKLRTINGFEISDPTSALQAYQRLLTADKLEVRLIRGGKPVTLEVNLH